LFFIRYHTNTWQLTLLDWYRHFNKKWRSKASFMSPDLSLVKGCGHSDTFYMWVIYQHSQQENEQDFNLMGTFPHFSEFLIKNLENHSNRKMWIYYKIYANLIQKYILKLVLWDNHLLLDVGNVPTMWYFAIGRWKCSDGVVFLA
jgi:hypothetical protein